VSRWRCLLAAKFMVASRADFEMRGLAISLLTLTRVASLDSLVGLLFTGLR
jgi:hypothetical protein